MSSTVQCIGDWCAGEEFVSTVAVSAAKHEPKVFQGEPQCEVTFPDDRATQ